MFRNDLKNITKKYRNIIISFLNNILNISVEARKLAACIDHLIGFQQRVEMILGSLDFPIATASSTVSGNRVFRVSGNCITRQPDTIDAMAKMTNGSNGVFLTRIGICVANIEPDRPVIEQALIMPFRTVVGNNSAVYI